MSFDIYAGENLLISAPLFSLTGDLTWKGPYDNATAYVPNDVVLGADFIGYKNILASTGNAPPNATYWVALPAVPAETIKRVLVELTQGGNAKVTWEYAWQGDPIDTPVALVQGSQYIISSFHAGDDFTNVGAASNATGVIFTATDTTPTTWTHGSVLQQVSYPPNFTLQNGLFQAELLAQDTVSLKGLFELRITLAVADTMYIQSKAQSDVLCLPDSIKITPC